MVLDIIVIALFVMFILAGIFKGAASMIFRLVLSFLSFLIASWLGKLIAGALYKAFCAPAIEKAAEQSLSSAGDLSEQLPFWAEKALSLSGKEIPRSSSSTAAQLSQAVNDVVQPIAVGVAAILLTLVLFLIIRLLLHRIVMPLILQFFRMPFVSKVNVILGGVIGAVEALMVVCMLAYILKLVLPYIDTDIGFLNETTIYNSFIFYHFYNGNIFTVLTSWL